MPRGLTNKVDEPIRGSKLTILEKILKPIMVGTLGLSILMAPTMIGCSPNYTPENRRTEQKYDAPKQDRPLVENEALNPLLNPSPTNLLLHPVWSELPGNVWNQPYNPSY